MKILAEDTSRHFDLCPGDTLKLSYKEVYDDYTKETLLLRQDITEYIHVNTVMVVQIEEGDLGLKKGIAGVFGEK